MHRPQRDAQAEREMIKRENKLFDVEINKAEFVKKKKKKTRREKQENSVEGMGEKEREGKRKYIYALHSNMRVCMRTSMYVWRTLSENKRNEECQRLFLSSKA